MLLKLAVFLCLSVSSTLAKCQTLGLQEGEFCKLAAGASWTCKKVKECPKAAKVIQDGGSPELCGWTRELDAIVCCEPEEGIGAKSRAMCKKYAESVFIRLPDELSDGGIRTYDTCGIAKPDPPRVKRLTGGVDSKTREYPHMALLGYENKTAPRWICAGTLISERFVMTTAHCADPTRNGLPKVVRLGDLNIKSETDEDESASQPSEYEAIQAFLHPHYKRGIYYNDIGLLRLNKDVFFTEFIRPICLQTEHRLPTTHALATGWGKTENGGKTSSFLLTIDIEFFSQDECNDTYGHIPSLKYGISEATMVCAGDKTGTKDTCQGDSGGPLQILLEEPYCMYSQVGITDFGSECGTGKPTVFTRVSHFVPWIESVVWP